MQHTSLLKVSVTVTAESEDAVAKVLEELFRQPVAVYHDLERGSATASVYLANPADWSANARLRLRAEVRRLKALGVDSAGARVSARPIRREDWAESWKRHFKPLTIGSTLLVKPGWSRRQGRRGQAVVVLDPGLSFGTGQHPTTRFCLEQIAAHREPSTRQSALDIGTGSGILAIAAAKLGYDPVEAFDCDVQAIRTTRANARKNGVADKLRLSRMDLARLPSRRRQFDLVCANLLFDLLLAQPRRILAQLKPGGTLVLAGLLRSQFAVVRHEYEQRGLKLVARRREHGWESAAFSLPAGCISDNLVL